MNEWSYFFWGLISQPLLNCVEGWQTAQFKKKICIVLQLV